MTPLLETVQLALTLKSKPLWNNLQLTLARPEILALVGPNGVGKSSLLRVLAGLLRPTEGKVLLHGRTLRSWSRAQLATHIGYLGQAFHPTFDYSVHEFVHFAGSVLRAPGFGRRVDQLLVQASLQPLEHRSIRALSGGELQRVRLCSVLAQGAELLLLDEPSAALDWAHRSWLWATLRELRAQGKTVILSTHDPTEAMTLADRIWFLCEQAPAMGPLPVADCTAQTWSSCLGTPMHCQTLANAVTVCVPMAPQQSQDEAR